MNFRHLIVNVCRYCRSPSKMLKAYRALRDYRIVANSPLFDNNWVIRQQPGFDNSVANPVLSVLVLGMDPSRNFCCEEYCELHGLSSGAVHPLVHYEQFGRRHGFVVSYHEKELNNGGLTNFWKHESLTYEKVLENQTKAKSRIRGKIDRKERIKIVFLVYSNSIFPGRSVFEKLLSDQSYEPSILVIPAVKLWPERVDAQMDVCYQELVAMFGSNVVSLAKKNEYGNWNDYLKDVDIICFPCPYDLSDFHYNPRWAAQREVLAIYFNYSYIVANFSLEVFKNDNFSYFWKVFVESESTLQDFAHCSVTKGGNAELVGYAKMDPLAFQMDQAARMSKQRKKLIIAPHHAMDSRSTLLSISNFLVYSDLFLCLPRKYPQIDFVMRPHPLVRPYLERNDVWGKERTEKYFSDFIANENASLSVEGEYFKLFAESDGMIQDCGSFLAEYFYTNKPQCYMLRSQDVLDREFTNFGRECLAHCYIARTNYDIINFIDTVILRQEDSMATDRSKFRERVISHYPHVVERVVLRLKECILDS